MTYKVNLSRIARLSAGSRLSLPGQDPMREEELRIELAHDYSPQDRFEQLWLEDIAYRVAIIEVIRAQIAGCRMRMVQSVLDELKRRAAALENLRAELERAGMQDNEGMPGISLSRAEHDALERWGKYSGKVPIELTNWLNNPQFAWLLGNLDPAQMQVLRQFQILEQEEVRERDRIIRQFERRRRQAVTDAVKQAELRHEAALAKALEGPEPDGATCVSDLAEDCAEAAVDAQA